MAQKKSEILRAKPCIALIGDMVASRDISREQRPGLQQRFKEFVEYMNKSYAREILSRFVITLGDEFQGLLKSASSIPQMMWDIEQRFPARHLRVGIGYGLLSTPLQKEAINIDGPALYNARDAIELARAKRTLGGVFIGFGGMDQIMNGFARILWFHRMRFTKQQRRIAGLLREGNSQIEVAELLDISRQAVSKQVKSMGWFAFTEAESAWRIFIEQCLQQGIEDQRAQRS